MSGHPNTLCLQPKPESGTDVASAEAGERRGDTLADATSVQSGEPPRPTTAAEAAAGGTTIASEDAMPSPLRSDALAGFVGIPDPPFGVLGSVDPLEFVCTVASADVPFEVDGELGFEALLH